MKQLSIRKKKGFTLVEILFAMSILMIVVAGVLPMYVQSSKNILTVDSKIDVNAQVRSITTDIISEAREADAYVLYDNYRGAWIEGDFVDFRSAPYHGRGRLRDGESGKMLVLLFYGIDPTPDDRNPAPLEKIIGIYLNANESSSNGSLQSFTVTDIDNTKSMEENLPTSSKMGSHDIVVQDVTGLIDGDVFYNFGGRSIMLSATLAHENGAIKETNTYNFTITPR
jgi:prepilin-type N-terminal cleavage/methylation domain-containing protein